MPSASPSPIKRPSLTERTSSNHSLSSSAKLGGHKSHRPHVVSRHSRNVSHGKGLSKLNKVNSTANVVADGKQHQRKKSGNTTPATSPKVAVDLKRNSSHVLLPKNSSHTNLNLRKNHSTTALASRRNVSHTQLKKIGLAPTPQPKEEDRKQGFFELGDHSSEGEGEGEWEDSNTVSPEFTRNNSKVSTPARAPTPHNDRVPSKPPEEVVARPDKASSSSAPFVKHSNKSAPDLRKESTPSAAHVPSEPPPLHNNGRASRAPPAMSTISARAGPSNLTRTDSTKSFTHVSHSEADSMDVTPLTPGIASSSLGDNGVSRFLPGTTPATSRTHLDDGSDYDSSSNFMENYRPQPSESPEKSRTFHKPRTSHIPSRTQQKLELQRRETMRAGPATPSTPSPSSLGYSMGSTASLHSRSGSRGRQRSMAGEVKAIKQDYESGIKQLTVVRRFRNPILESLLRLKAADLLPNEVGAATPVAGFSKSRPPSRRGIHNPANANGAGKAGLSRSMEDRKPSPLESRSSSRARGGRVHFQRQGSHDDIGITQASPEGLEVEQEDDVSPEEALLRRIWESREVYEPADSGPVR